MMSDEFSPTAKAHPHSASFPLKTFQKKAPFDFLGLGPICSPQTSIWAKSHKKYPFVSCKNPPFPISGKARQYHSNRRYLSLLPCMYGKWLLPSKKRRELGPSLKRSVAGGQRIFSLSRICPRRAERPRGKILFLTTKLPALSLNLFIFSVISTHFPLKIINIRTAEF